MSDDIAIRVEHVSKTFKLPLEKQASLKSKLINFNKRGYENLRALDDVSFEVKKGEFFGIVGRNGSGKSTLLKMLAGIYTPTEGNIQVNGKLTPFIELGVGFNPELSGRDNIFLNGALLGFGRKEMAAMYDDIVEFAELEKFMDQKLKNYSSGMQVRLAFSIAIRAESEILVLDEVLAVGDEAFQRKCFEYFSELKRKHKTVILVTHGMESMKKFCTRAILIDKGEIVASGNPESVAYEYDVLNAKPSNKRQAVDVNASQWGTGGVEIVDVKLHKGKEGTKNIIKPGDNFDLIVKFKVNDSSVTKINYSLGVNSEGFKCFDISTYYTKPLAVANLEGGSIRVHFTDIRLLPGTYDCNMSIFNEDMSEVYYSALNIFTVNVLGAAREVKATGIVKTESEITLL